MSMVFVPRWIYEIYKTIHLVCQGYTLLRLSREICKRGVVDVRAHDKNNRMQALRFELTVCVLPGHLHFQGLSLPFFCFLSPSALQVWTNVITDPCRRPARETEAGTDTQVFQTGYIRPNRPSVYLCNWTLRIRRRRFQAKWASYCLFGINYQGEWKPHRPQDPPPKKRADPDT